MNFKNDVRKFLRQTGMPKTRFGRLAVNDPNFVDRLERSEPRPETISRVQRFMEDYQNHE